MSGYTGKERLVLAELITLQTSGTAVDKIYLDVVHVK